MRITSPGCNGQSPLTNWSPTMVPLRLSRSRSVQRPPLMNISR